MLGRGGERGEIREVITLEELGKCASLDVLRRLEAGERGERGQKINEAYPSTDPPSREASSRRTDQKRDPNLVVIEIETVIPAAMFEKLLTVIRCEHHISGSTELRVSDLLQERAD